jgi:hypothetical protein
VSRAPGVYSEKETNVNALGPHDPTPEGITEEVCVFFGSPKYVTELLVDIFRRR